MDDQVTQQPAMHDEAAKQFAQDIIDKCNSLPLGESVIIPADTEITLRAIPIIDAYFNIASEGRASTRDEYMMLYAGSGRIQKRYHMNLKQVYYDNFF